jgi:hypothetical protein
MIIDNFHVACFARLPSKANTPLVVNANAILTSPIAMQLFKPVTRRRTQIEQVVSVIQIQQFSPST